MLILVTFIFVFLFVLQILINSSRLKWDMMLMEEKYIGTDFYRDWLKMTKEHNFWKQQIKDEFGILL